MDNRIFNVNGKTKYQLTLALNSLLYNEYDKINNVKAWYFNEDKGLVLCWHYNQNDKRYNPFTDNMGKPKSISIEELTDILWDWLKTDEANSV